MELMAEIMVLPRQVAELIAAGEVVERPASVVKELCENSIDAGATSVTVELKHGGITYLRITDNGCGIPRSQVARAFLRHATSKVRTQDDLAAIGTLGFRGEALASVAAMSRTEMLTRTAEEEIGTRYVIAGGVEELCEDAGCPVGTTIVVRDLFYNTPARMKFLKKDVTEGNSAAAAVEKMALSHPGVAFTLIRDGERRLSTPGDGQLPAAVYAVCGREFASGLVPVESVRGGCGITGLISKPECCRATRAQQTFFINGRFIHSRTCAAALEEAYRNSRMVNKFPGCVLFLTVDLHSVDVNVHPAKTEVRFSDEKAIFDLVYYGCKTALQQMGNITQAADRQSAGRRAVNPLTIESAPLTGEQQHLTAQQYRALVQQEPAAPQRGGAPAWNVADSALRLETAAGKPQLGRRPAPDDADLWHGHAQRGSALNEPLPEVQAPVSAAVQPAPAPAQAARPAAPARPENRLGGCRLIGELLETYLLLEDDKGLLLVDKHAAHERVLFERLRRDRSDLCRQLLLSPVLVRLSREQYAAALEHLSVYADLGFGAEDFGDGSLLVREAPVILPQGDIPLLVEEVAQRLADSSADPTPQLLDDLLHSVACRAAIKAGTPSHPQEQQAILEMLEADPSLRTCPHGRPIAVSLSKHEIEKLFGRVK